MSLGFAGARRAPHTVRLSLLALAVSALGACTLTRPTVTACEATADCRAAFGFGYTCGDDGLCAPVAEEPRCARTFPENLLSSETYADAFVIGSIVDATLETHLARERSVALALSEAQDQGGVAERPVGVVFCTNQVDATIDELEQREASVHVARYLSQQIGVRVIVGPPSSASTEAVYQAIAGEDVIVISPSATSAALTTLEPDASDETPGQLWRTAPPDALQGRVIADDLTTRGVTDVAVIYEEGPYGIGLADELEASFGGTLTRFMFADGSARNTASTNAGSGDFEEVLFVSSQTSDVSAFVLFAESFAGYATKGIFVTDSAANSDFLTDTASASAIYPRIRGTRPAAPEGRVFESFVSAYAAENGGADARVFSFAPHSYDATWLAIYGASWAHLQEGGVLDRVTIARGMRQLSAGTPLDVSAGTYPQILDRFRLGEGVDVEGASGQLDYDPVTEETAGPIEVFTIASGGTSFMREYVVTP